MKILFLSRVPFKVFKNYSDVITDKIFVVTDSRFFNEYIQNLENVYHFDYYLNNDKIVNFSVDLIKNKNIDLVIAVDESDVERAAVIRRLAGLTGQSEFCAIRYRDKLIMKDTLRDYDIEMPIYQSIKNKKDIEKFGSEYGYPLVLKHKKSWATNNTFKINCASDLDKASEKIETFEDYIVEEWIDARMYTVEGIQKDGSLIWYAIHEYDRNCLESVINNDDGFTTLTSKIMDNQRKREQIKTYTEKILNLLNKSEKFISAVHLEFFITNDNRLIFNEVACRIGGGKTIQLLKHAYNINFIELLIEQHKNQLENIKVEFPPITKPQNYIGAYRKYFIERKVELDSLAEKNNWILELEKNQMKNVNEPIVNINNFEAMILIKEDSYEALNNRLLELKNY
ncbi:MULTISPECIES: acetyl-CoA carboxylase biotin carboxylase subunit family protein [Niallia]|uniref:ATP-grasp domain-containing protein n=1 Tax=Niallia alba TaxID=2729105 RepID=A0A7Y0PNS6_9BACI|nr:MULTISPECIES: ATP-grasp domain-containing protein [Niallia]NMO79413.1 ATP-grasp domain-containing protein [Niallia alba]UTI42717.1 ATP-grasp domain-containing protein [Niallia sp. RD1]